MATYTVQFFWPPTIQVQDEPSRGLDAQSFSVAKIQAAMLFATLKFRTGTPQGYQILQDDGAEVYRFPEPTSH